MVFNHKFARVLKRGEGFTLIELIITVALLTIIFSLGPFLDVAVLRDFQISQEAGHLEGNLRGLQFLALHQKNDSAFGIKFSEDRYLLFEGPSFARKNEIFRIHLLPEGFIISGPEEIIFEKVTGKPSWEGVIRISETAKGGIVLHRREVSINFVGNIETLR